MNDQTYPPDAGADVFLLTVLGTPKVDSVDTARELHNATAGNPAGVAGAKALGDLSHNVFLPASSSELRLLFVDTWNSPSGVGQFFGDEHVLEGAAALFAERAATLWMPAAGYGSYALPAPSGLAAAAVGTLRAPVSSLDDAQAVFRAESAGQINRARRAGQLAHTLWVPVPMPGTEPTTEVLGLDYWLEIDAMNEYYDHADYTQLSSVFTGAPETGVWKCAGSDWVEW